MTLKRKTINGIPRTVKEVEEHISVVEEPGSQYLHHITPKDGSGLEIAKSLFKSMDAIDANDDLEVCGNDGALVNNGADNGVCACYESFVDRPFQRCSCLLHANELPFRACLVKHVGPTTGPSSWSGPMSDHIKDPDLNERPIVVFQKIDCPNFPVMPEHIQKDLSTEQHYLYDMAHGLISGKIDKSLAGRKTGQIVMSRWVNTAADQH